METTDNYGCPECGNDGKVAGIPPQYRDRPTGIWRVRYCPEHMTVWSTFEKNVISKEDGDRVY